MEEIKEALENKEVERIKETPTDSDSVVAQTAKSKKVRSQKQIDAFEKARKKRAENIALKKTQKETLKKEKKERKTTINETPSIIDNLPTQVVEKLREDAVRPTYKPKVVNTQPQVINNYYYGSEFKDALTRQNSVAQPKGNNVKPTLKKVSTPPPQDSSSSDEEYYEEEIIQGGVQPSNPKLQYRFV